MPLLRSRLRRAVVVASLALLPATVAAQAGPRGSFVAKLLENSDRVQILFSSGERAGEHSRIVVGDDSLGEIRGLSAEQLAVGGPTPLRFMLVRDAGTVIFDGVAARGEARGRYVFHRDYAFGVLLARRGMGRPSEADAFRLTIGNVGYAFLHELTVGGYPVPSVWELVRMGLRGVDVDYLRGISAARVRLRAAAELTALHEHGVTPEYVADMRRAGYADVGATDLLRLKDHGIDPAFVAELAAAGFNDVSVDDAIRAREHDVDALYAQEFRRAGFMNLTLGDLIRLRDHGVNASFARRLRERRRGAVSATDLVLAKGREDAL